MKISRMVAVVGVLACGGALFRLTLSESATTVVQGGTLLEQLVDDVGFGSFLDMDLVSSEELQNQGVSPGDIQEVYLVDFVLVATDPPGADLAFLDRLEVFVEAPQLPRVRIASQSDFPEGIAEASFELEDVDLTDYVVSESMTITTDATGRRPDDDTTIEATFEIELGVTQQGLCNNL